MRRSRFVPLLLLGLLLIPVALSACDSNDTTAQSRFRVLLTDAPLDDIVAAHVTVERVEVLGTDDRVILLADNPQAFDLLALQDGVTVELADVDIPDDTYTQVRVVVAEGATVEYSDGTSEDLKIPSGTQTGIKINLPPLELTDDVVEVTLDFDVADSFVQRGNSGMGYIFKPVIKPLTVFVNDEEVPFDENASAR